MRDGIAATTGRLVVIQDADLEYDPKDLPDARSSPLLEGHADVVYGTRLRGGEPQRAHLFWHYAGNRFLSLLTNVLFNTTISDMEVGYKAFRGDLIRGAAPGQRRLPLRARGHREGAAGHRASASTRCRSPTTGARSPRARRSRGATAMKAVGALVRFRFSG